MVYEDANSKLVKVVTVDDEDRVGNSLLQIWKLRFGHEAPVLEIEFGPPHTNFGSVWSSQKARKF